MPSELKTSTMKSPPLEVWFTGSAAGGTVSAATCRGPGMAALRGGAAGTALAVVGATNAAAAPATLAPLRKLRRLESAEWRRFDMTAPWDRSPPRHGSAVLFA